MLDFIIFAVTFLAVLIVAIIWLYPGSKAVTTVPGLTPSDNEDGNLGDIAKAGSLHEFLMQLHSQFGPISGFWWGQTYVVSIASPELFTQHKNVFDRPPLLFKSFEELIGGNSIQYANGAEGRSRRKEYDPSFTFDKMEKYMYYFDECASKTEAKWLSKTKDDHVALSDCFTYAMFCASLTIIGDYHYSMPDQFQDFKDAYHQLWNMMENKILNPSSVQDECNIKQLEKAKAFLQSLIKKAIEHRKKEESSQFEDLFIDVLIEKCRNEEILLSDTTSYMVGSFHTTGNLIIWALYFIASHKEVQDKLYKEVRSVIGDTAPVEHTNFSDLVYLIQVIDETLRCAVLAPTASRFQDFDSELGGHRIPKNTPIIHALGVLMKDEKLWPLPNKFDPERFSPENRKKIPTNAFVPFGFAGGRKCPGFRFAYWDAGVFLARIIRRFEVTLCADQVVTPVYGLVTHPQEEIWVTLKKRN